MDVVVVNGERHEIDADASGQLIGWLRQGLGLTGTKPGCGEGECGACTVLADGVPVLSCRTPLRDVAGTSITTIEGLAASGVLNPVQQALADEHASQCGYCMPAMALRAVALLEKNLDPENDDVADALGPNLCRCGGYARIRRALFTAAALRRAAGAPSPTGAPPVPAATHNMEPLPRPRRPWDLSPPDDRDYLALLGPGLVCVWPPAQAPGMWGTTNGGAWVHVSPSGAVTAFSGKVDVGQDNRTALRILVADELRVAPDAVDLIQGDTDLCPFDVGTFGSRSMPDAGEALRRAAAGAQAALRELGAGEPVSDGCRVVVLDAEPSLAPISERRFVGRRGHEGSHVDAITGARRYVSDLSRPEMAHGAVLRPPVPGAVLRSADLTPAAEMAGVTVVEDGPFIGVTAEDLATARRAVAAIKAEWEWPPPIDDDLAGYLRAHPTLSEGWARAVDTATGDVAGALASAACTLEATYTTAYIAHVPLETRAALAEWNDGRVTVWTGTQVPFGVREHLAAALRLEEEDVRVIVPPTGGAFGGKHGGEVATEAARLARATGRPVKVHWSRAEELQWGTVRPFAVIDVRAGLDVDGALAAWDFLDINAGPAALDLPYKATTRRLRYQPAGSPLRQGSYRALGATANNFARESAIDELARAKGTDPLAFRLHLLADERLAAVLRAAAERFGWAAESAAARDARAGRGLAVGLEKDGRVATCAEVHVDADDHVSVRRVVTAYECGTVVNPDTVVNQIEGATMMALGGALIEEIPLERGRFLEPSLSRYPLPRFRDLPEIEVVLLDRPDLPSAGAGETPMIALAPAVANAIFTATGQRLRALPLAPGGRLA